MLDPSEILMTHVQAVAKAKRLLEEALALEAKGKKRDAAKKRKEAEKLARLVVELENEVKPRRPF